MLHSKLRGNLKLLRFLTNRIPYMPGGRAEDRKLMKGDYSNMKKILKAVVRAANLMYCGNSYDIATALRNC